MVINRSVLIFYISYFIERRANTLSARQQSSVQGVTILIDMTKLRKTESKESSVKFPVHIVWPLNYMLTDLRVEYQGEGSQFCGVAGLLDT